MTHASQCPAINSPGAVLEMESYKPWEDEKPRPRAMRVCPVAAGHGEGLWGMSRQSLFLFLRGTLPLLINVFKCLEDEKFRVLSCSLITKSSF